MNKQRRKELSEVQDRVTRLGALISQAKDMRAEIVEELERLRDEEQEAFDALPEGLQQGERGQDMENAISELDSAIGELEGADLDFGGDEADAVIEQIDNARGAE